MFYFNDNYLVFENSKYLNDDFAQKLLGYLVGEKQSGVGFLFLDKDKYFASNNNRIIDRNINLYLKTI